jgi:hypothetical protein
VKLNPYSELTPIVTIRTLLSPKEKTQIVMVFHGRNKDGNSFVQ